MSDSKKERFEVSDVLEALGDAVLRVIGPADRVFTHPAPVSDTGSVQAITFNEKVNPSALDATRASGASVVICPDDGAIDLLAIPDKTLILVANPRISFIRVMRAFFTDSKAGGIHPSAVIDQGASVHRSVHVGPQTYVGPAEIGEGTVIEGNAHIYPNSRIGRDVIIYAGAVIGSHGENYHRNEKGELELFPHIGGVVLEDGVEVGANTCIDRGTLTDTVIGEGTKIDNQVHIAHTVKIGKRCLILAGAIIAGNVVIGDDVWIGPGVVVSNSLNIGDKAVLTIGSTVGTDVDPGETVTGFFAVQHDQFLRSWYAMLKSSK